MNVVAISVTEKKEIEARRRPATEAAALLQSNRCFMIAGLND
jgi:hypothetical protein